MQTKHTCTLLLVISELVFLAPEKSYTRQKTSPFSGRASEEEVKVDVHRALTIKQETEEEDIDEVVRTYKESEAVGQSDTGNAGGFLSDGQNVFLIEETHQYSLITGMTLNYLTSNSLNNRNGTQDILVSSRKSLCPSYRRLA